MKKISKKYINSKGQEVRHWLIYPVYWNPVFHIVWLMALIVLGFVDGYIVAWKEYKEGYGFVSWY